MTEQPAGESESSAAPPTCYRHPERESHIRCGRCERPICPDCMVTAAVGFQCPECVQEGKATVREARTLAGGVIHGDPMLVSKILIGLNVAVFVVNLVLDDRLFKLFAMQGGAVALEGEQYRLITSAFLHSGLTHLAFNMLALWFVGGAVEPRLGRWRYLTVYLLSALGGSVLSYVVDSPLQVSVGASGAVFALGGVLTMMRPGLRVFVFPIPVPLPLWVAVIGGFLILSIPSLFPNIAWQAHLGGVIFGLIAGYFFRRRERRYSWR